MGITIPVPVANFTREHPNTFRSISLHSDLARVQSNFIIFTFQTIFSFSLVFENKIIYGRIPSERQFASQ